MKSVFSALLLGLLSLSITSVASAQTGLGGNIEKGIFTVCAAVVPCDPEFNVLETFLGDGSPEGDFCAVQYAKVCEAERARFLKERKLKREQRKQNRKDRQNGKSRRR
jgi:hypothetical protein